MTSSLAAIYGDNSDAYEINEDMFNEDHWNTTSGEKHQAYSYSKTEAEREAWKIANENERWDLAVINPGFVIGPSLTKRKDSTSINFMLSFLNGTFKQGIPAIYFGVVDVRDVAQAHVNAATDDKAEGRYILASETKSTLEMAQILRDYLGDQYPIPRRKMSSTVLYMAAPFVGFTWKYIRRNVNIPIYFDNKRTLNQLNINFNPPEQSLKDQANQVIQDGLLKK